MGDKGNKRSIYKVSENKRMMKMKKAGISFEEMKIDMLKDEEFKAEYEKLKPRYEAIEQIIRAKKN